MHRSLISLTLFVAAALAQDQTARLQSVGFNSSFTLSQAQVEAASLTAATAADVENIVRFDRSQLANGGPVEDDFYTLPSLTNTTALEPGVLLKVQDFTNTSSFTLPPNTALSRILYTTTNLNGTVLPASAFILWPFQPRQFGSSSFTLSPRGVDSRSNGTPTAAPVVLWSHGTAGFFASQGPSTHRSLWYANAAPFTLAQAGYAVVAADYAGLGVSVSWDGSEIPHQYLASRVSARDGLYALRAAWEAFPGLLTREFVSMGHSQGGGVAWGVAEVLAGEEADAALADLAAGYRGTVAGSPTTDLFTGIPQFIVPWVSMFLGGIFPSFDPADWLTPLGIARVKLLREIEGGIGVSQQLFLNPSEDAKVIKDSYNEMWYMDAYGKLANVGSRPFAGPLLVIQGTSDVYIPYDVTTKTVSDTCAYLESQGLNSDLEYAVVNGTGHVPTLDATRSLWLQWLQERFEGKQVTHNGCITTHIESFLPLERYQAAGNSFIQWAGAPEYSFETPLGP
ncbi:hypothetical protein F5Y19DRAFT_475754 [Xylariaceae sp. FL1651]|nr:hypothetical protein F5Y19DRAFT_475754 [Xylariaceae sp. FL1651]